MFLLLLQRALKRDWGTVWTRRFQMSEGHKIDKSKHQGLDGGMG